LISKFEDSATEGARGLYAEVMDCVGSEFVRGIIRAAVRWPL